MHAFAIVVTIIQPLPIFIPFFLLSCSGRRKQKNCPLQGFLSVTPPPLPPPPLCHGDCVANRHRRRGAPPSAAIVFLFFFFPLCTVHSRNEKKKKGVYKIVCVRAWELCSPSPLPCLLPSSSLGLLGYNIADVFLKCEVRVCSERV